ncbi:MAG: leucyl/phenylalanyl-tRNA--protein transferase [Verrucomicrobiia bacterium]|jgi:leucyl/phenylalanyl-tRNA--protein transferase
MKSDYFPALLDERLVFPDPRLAAEEGDFEGLVALGGDLSVERLRLAYRSGIFPWSVDPITWWSPSQRGVIPLDDVCWGRSLLKEVRRRPFQVTINRAFREVVMGCQTQPRPGGWISEEFVDSYTELHKQGHAHSVECWRDAELVGGVYGVQVGGAFAGESMFHRESNASKIALYHLVERLREREFVLFDTQMVTDTTARIGAVEMPRDEYLTRLASVADMDCVFA